MPQKASIVISTFRDEKFAADTANVLVARRLCACATLVPVHSIYTWKGSVQNEQECMVLFKTTNAAKKMLMRTIAELHSYDVPEIIAFDMSGVSSTYYGWLQDSTKGIPKNRNHSSKRRNTKPNIR